MSYQIDDQTGVIKAFAAGVNENVTLDNIAIEPEKEGSANMVLKFYFTGPNGERAIHTEFAIDEKSAKERALKWKKTPEEVVKRDYETQGARIKHILSAFMDVTGIKIIAKSWREYLETIIKTANMQFVGQKFRIKLVYNKKNFLSFPKSTGNAFIQNMEEECSLVVTPKDIVTPYEMSGQGPSGGVSIPGYDSPVNSAIGGAIPSFDAPTPAATQDTQDPGDVDPGQDLPSFDQESEEPQEDPQSDPDPAPPTDGSTPERKW